MAEEQPGGLKPLRDGGSERWWRPSFEAGRTAGLDHLARAVPQEWKTETRDWLDGYDLGRGQYKECVAKQEKR